MLFRASCRGEVVPDGYGIAYSTLANQFLFHVCSRTTMHPDTLCREVEKAMGDLLMIMGYDTLPKLLGNSKL